jgi:hypothetical protein
MDFFNLKEKAAFSIFYEDHDFIIVWVYSIGIRQKSEFMKIM